MDLRELLRPDPDDRAGEIGALGAIAGAAAAVLLGSGGNPLLWASAGGIAGLLIGVVAAELRSLAGSP
ncbi:hypothetical protein ACFQMA_07105 [Halosimplex aquaticum]|uniref:Uncharacterized protein n=1 Tax=Halosimplex aquaticum TaxID=3026162 RepID=A0ABD5XX11_9EURY|nr:hypothetical protein [Halosimplex aquaticum]